MQVPELTGIHGRFFDPKAKQEHHDNVFPEDLNKAFKLGAEMIKKAW